MKRFFSLMLAVLLLVSALPFAAFAAEEVKCTTHPTAKVAYRGEAFDVAATCEKGATKSYLCFAGAELTSAAHNFDVEVSAANGHKWNDGAVTTQPTCTTAGEKTFTCTVANCGETKTEPVAMLEHTYVNPTITTASTCAAEGVETSTCACGAKKTTAIAKLAHNYVNAVCTACGDKQGQGITFHYLNAAGEWTTSIATIRSGDTISLPTIPAVSTKDHIGWNTNKNGTGDSITSSTKWYNDMATDFWAIYEVDTTEDDIVDLTVYAHYYVDGVYHHKEKLFVKEFEETTKNTMFTWLYSNDGLQKTTAALEEDGYQWTSKIFYDYYDDGAVTEADLKSDGNKSVYVKVTSKKAIEATVLLYVHTKKEHANDRVISMSGFTAGDYVSHDDVLTAVKKYYTGSKLSIGNLYNESDWEDLLAGLSSSGSRSVKVETNGTTEIHIILSNATAKSGSKADSSNPKTGDYITIAVGTMVLAAAALVTVTELKKRKMI